jgi:AcrR family transcriptional regulator
MVRAYHSVRLLGATSQGKILNRRVTREAWLDAARQALGEGGLPALSPEPLARRLGVTKGSFYHYFTGIDAFVVEVVAQWEAVGTEALIVELDRVADPRERLTRLLAAAWDEVGHLRAEAALLIAAISGDERVRPTCLRVHRRRLAYVVDLYAQLGLAPADAERSGLTAYMTYLGTVLMAALDTSLFGAPEALRAFVAFLPSVLLPSAGEHARSHPCGG